jgi:hypothetical protein
MIGQLDGLVWLHEEKERRTVNCDGRGGAVASGQMRIPERAQITPNDF